MIRTFLSSSRQLGKMIGSLACIFALAPALYSAQPPKQLTKVIDHFMSMEATSLRIKQVIDWRFGGSNDTVRVQMDIQAGKQFHVSLNAFGIEIFVTEDEMVTLNHVRGQVLYENATPDALLKQLFAGGDLNDARFKKKSMLDGGKTQLDFRFASDFSDWESLSVVLNQSMDLEKMILVDYDGNKYKMTMTYLPEFQNFLIPDIEHDFLHYQIADLRSTN